MGVLREDVEFGLRDVSVVVPVHNDEKCLLALLKNLEPYSDLDIVVVDSKRNERLSLLSDPVRYLVSPHFGRGPQISYGISSTERSWIWILHADSLLTKNNITELELSLARCCWGRFDIRLDGTRYAYRVIEWFMNSRSALTGICTGDQGIFVRRKLLHEIGGFPDQMLMEDIELSKRLRKRAKPMRIRVPLATSARRWKAEGIASTVVRMWSFRLRYFFGADPNELYGRYYDSK